MNTHIFSQLWTILPVFLMVIAGFTNPVTSDLGISDSPERANHMNVIVNSSCSSIPLSVFEARDCTVTVKTDDMDIELTLHDVSWWDCTKLKLKALWEFGF